MLELPDGSICLPRPSMASRKVAKGRREHFTGQLNVGPDEGTCMDIESYTEFQVALTLLARPEVTHVENQVPFTFLNADGRPATHFFDFLATHTDGSRHAIMVKSDYRFRSPRVSEELRLIASQVNADFAERVMVMTEKHFTTAEFFNAEMMHEMRWPDPVVDGAALRVVQPIIGAVRISDLVEAIGHGGQGFRAVVRLIRDRHLAIPDGIKISYDASVTRNKQDA
ncbi:hypothetical protein K3720_04390 [Leisingera caerulea]|uniref:hypothetical protein n=1 Tax=Leisingera caerulea TaxID=506591 RepID=UPI0021A38793|nr:hypothetical protein [Leisingera caerulea]UWQ50652.1 hypothetical protein K3720_04390 [Leisingera caerulea]